MNLPYILHSLCYEKYFTLCLYVVQITTRRFEKSTAEHNFHKLSVVGVLVFHKNNRNCILITRLLAGGEGISKKSNQKSIYFNVVGLDYDSAHQMEDKGVII